MSTTLTRPNATATEERPVTFARALHSEWIKLRSLRSSLILLACTIAVMIAIGALGAVGVTSADEGDPMASEAVIQTLPGAGLVFGQLTIGALAALTICSEFATGMIRSTMIAVPRRIPAVLAKGLLITVVSFIVGTMSAGLTYFIVQPILEGNGMGFDFDRAVAGSILCTGLYLTLIGLMGLGLGTLMRNSAGSIVTLTTLLLVLPTALSMIPGDFASTVSEYLPSNAGAQLTATQIAEDALTQLQGGLVLGAWALTPFLIALVVIKRRDV
jgi:ABC-2 type transport system permease protein